MTLAFRSFRDMGVFVGLLNGDRSQRTSVWPLLTCDRKGCLLAFYQTFWTVIRHVLPFSEHPVLPGSVLETDLGKSVGQLLLAISTLPSPRPPLSVSLRPLGPDELLDGFPDIPTSWVSCQVTDDYVWI